MKFIIAFICAIFVFSACVYAAPDIFDPTPANNSFYGRGIIDVSINITGQYMNTSTVGFFVISEDAYIHDEAWDNYTLPCTSYGTNAWKCKTGVSFAVVESDTLEFFYFTVNDTIGEHFDLGNSSKPMTFKIDRTPPEITFEEPLDRDYVSGNRRVVVSASDAVSGVNDSTMKLSTDNATWMNMTNNTGYFNTTQYTNNITKTLFVTVCDNVGNCDTANINVTIDNEIPKLTVISPSASDILEAVEIFTVNASDIYSGIGAGNVKYKVLNTAVGMTCNNDVCSANVDTNDYSDGDYNINFTVTDNAGNSNTTAIPVEIKNIGPTVKLKPEGYISGIVSINATVTKSDIVEDVLLKMQKGDIVYDLGMNCNSEKTSCTHSIDTGEYADAPYTLTATVENILNHTIQDSVLVIIDNTNPIVSIGMADFVRGIFPITITVTDENHHAGRVTLTISGNSVSLSCSGQTGVLVCSAQYNSENLNEGSNTAQATATDQAWHSASASKSFAVDNNPPEFKSMKIEPLQTESFLNVSFLASVEDEYSGVKTVNITIDNMGLEDTIYLKKVSGLWFGKAIFEDYGTYRVRLGAADNVGNSKTYRDIGYFYIGPISCGDGVCQSAENYCLCAIDCAAPTCQEGQEIGCTSGVPLCITPGACGDGICSDLETCTSCPTDCGNCTVLESVVAEKIEFVEKYPSEKSEKSGLDSFFDTNINISEYSYFDFMINIIAVIAAIILAIIIFLKTHKKEDLSETFLSKK